jgi:glycosyltransferase involved in cell wall biosynthesis
VRILLVSGMYPSPRRPDFGIFVARIADELRARGHEVDEAVVRAGARGVVATPLAYAGLLGRTLAQGRRRRPDVVYAHFLVPPGLIGALVGRPLVVTAHGQDVENARRSLPLRLATRVVLRRAAAVVCVSQFLAGRLGVAAEVIDCGVDTGMFRPAERAPGAGPRFLFVGSLTPRKNVGRLMEAFARLGEGSLTIVGDGPLGEELRAAAPAGVRFAGRVLPRALVAEIHAHDVVCQPSLVEPQGQVLLEALACGRPVVATRVGGPAEIVTPACGVLVDPLDVDAIAAGMRTAAALPIPCEAGVRIAADHALSIQVSRIEAILARAAAPA